MLSLRLLPRSGALSSERFHRAIDAIASLDVGPDAATYLCSDTGVTFELAFVRDLASDAIGAIELEWPALRSTPFTEEVADLVAELAAALSWDASIDGGPAGPFSREAFLAAFREARVRALEAHAAHGLATPIAIPSARLSAIHRWNRERAERQRRVGEAAFVPQVMLALVDGVPSSFVVFPDGVPTHLPSFVDHVLVHRVDFAPMRSMLEREDRPALLTRAEATSLLGALGHEDEVVGAFVPEYADPTPELARAITALPILACTFQTLAPERVIDA